MIRAVIVAVLMLLLLPAATQTIETITTIFKIDKDSYIRPGESVASHRTLIERKTVIAPCSKSTLSAHGASECADTGLRRRMAKRIQHFGVNLSGCEFGAGTSLCPTETDVEWYAKAGFTLIRIPLKDEQFVAPKIVALTRSAQAKGLEVILDRHDYKYHAPADAVAFWTKVLPLYSSDTMVELANEPVKAYPEGNKWDHAAAALNPTVQGIRAAGFNHRILVGWPGWNAIFRVDKNEAAEKTSESFLTAVDRVGGLKDPIDRTFLSGHRYPDKDGSGTKGTCNAPADAGVAAWAKAMRRRGLKGYLTEFAFGNATGIPASCVAVGQVLMAAVKANSDVILGTAAWGGGRAWPDKYIFKVEPKKDTRKGTAISPYVQILVGQ